MSFERANASIDLLIALGPRMGSARGLERLENELLHLNAILASEERAAQNDLLRLKGIIDGLSGSLTTLQQLVTSRIAALRPETASADQS